MEPIAPPPHVEPAGPLARPREGAALGALARVPKGWAIELQQEGSLSLVFADPPRRHFFWSVAPWCVMPALSFALWVLGALTANDPGHSSHSNGWAALGLYFLLLPPLALSVLTAPVLLIQLFRWLNQGPPLMTLDASRGGLTVAIDPPGQPRREERFSTGAQLTLRREGPQTFLACADPASGRRIGIAQGTNTGEIEGFGQLLAEASALPLVEL